MLETCTICDDETGRAGAGDDSLYLEDGTGPYCERCFEIRCLRAEVERLTRERDEARAAAEAYRDLSWDRLERARAALKGG